MQGSATDYLAAERTVLAWIRTGIALMGLGFVLARFGLFLQEFNHLQPYFQVRPYGISLWIGVALILMGVAVCLLSMLRHLRMLKQLETGESLYLRSPRLVIGVAVALILLGLLMTGYLIFAIQTPWLMHLCWGRSPWQPMLTTELCVYPVTTRWTRPWRSCKAFCRRRA